MTGMALAFVAGILTTLNPCVLPMLPLVSTGAFAEGRWGPLALAGGLILSFTTLGVGLAVAGHQIGLDPSMVRQLAGGLLLLSGLVLVYRPAQAVFARLTAPVAGGATTALNRLSLAGNSGQFTLGLLLGAVWSPCVGPTLGAAVAAAATGEGLGHATVTMATFGTGMASVFLVLAALLRRATAANRDRLARVAAGARKFFGWTLLAVGVLVVSGMDKTLEALLLQVLPAALLDLTTRF